MPRLVHSTLKFGLYALTLWYASLTAIAADQPFSTNHGDFGPSPDDFEIANRQAGTEIGTLTPTPSGTMSLRDRLTREGILDEATFAGTRPPLKFRPRQPQVEEFPLHVVLLRSNQPRHASLPSMIRIVVPFISRPWPKRFSIDMPIHATLA